MKKSYEKHNLLFSFIFIFFLSIIFFLLFAFKIKYNTYINLSACVSDTNRVEVLMTNDELKKLRQNKYVYLENRRIKRKIEKVIRNILKRENTNYHYVTIYLNLDKKYKKNDYINLVIYDKKELLISLFKICWKEENAKD